MAHELRQWTPEQLADNLLARLEGGGMVYEGRPVDRAWVLETLERARVIPRALLDEYLREELGELSDLGEAELEHLVEIREQVRMAIVRRLGS